jgi:alcohol/geraniol dehydrogenase (NADP+)
MTLRIPLSFNYFKVSLHWQAYIDTLSPRGRLYFVGAVPESVPLVIFPMMLGQKQLSASALGSPVRDHGETPGILWQTQDGPVVEEFPMSEGNKALKHLENGNAR